MNFYRYIFYCFYRYYTFEKDKLGKVYFVIFLMTLLESFNLASLMMLIRVNQHWNFTSKPVSFIIFIFLSASNLHLFAKNKNYEAIITNKNFGQSYSGATFRNLMILYYITTFILLFISVYLDSTNGSWAPFQQYMKGLGL